MKIKLIILLLLLCINLCYAEVTISNESASNAKLEIFTFSIHNDHENQIQQFCQGKRIYSIEVSPCGVNAIVYVITDKENGK